MSLITKLTSLAQAIAADIKALTTGKADASALSDYRTILNTRFTKVTTLTDYVPVVDSLDYGVRFDYTIRPGSPSQAVSPAILTTFTVNTAQAGLVGEAHGIGHLDVYSITGGDQVNLIFGKETRIGMKNNSYLGEFLLHKWVMEPNATNQGTIGTITVDGLDDMSVSAPYVGKFRKLYADPRFVDYNAGGHVISPAIIDGNVTLSDKHSGKIIYLNSFNDVTVTIGAQGFDVTDGFRVKIVQGTLGGRITLATPTRNFLAGITRLQTQGSFDNVEVLAAGGAYLMLEWPLSVKPIVSVDTTTARTLTVNDGYVQMNNAAATVVTVPPQSAALWPDDAEILIEQAGAGAVTIAAGAGVTINTSTTLRVPGRYGAVMLKRTGLNTWTLRNAKAMIFDDLLVNAAATGTVTLNVGAAQVFDITLTGNTTLAFSNIPVPVGQSYSWLVRVTQGGTARTLAFPTVTWLTSGGTSPGAPAANKVIEYIFSTQNGTLVLARKGAFT